MYDYSILLNVIDETAMIRKYAHRLLTLCVYKYMSVYIIIIYSA